MSKYRSLSFSEFITERMDTEGIKTDTRETLTDAQYALIYLIFKGKTSALQQPYRSQEAKELRIMGGLSDQTVRHRIREMQILAGGEDQAKKGDEYYEDILSKLQDRADLTVHDLRRTARLYLTFQELDIQDVAAIAMEAFTDENKEKGQHYYDKNIERQSKYAQDMKHKQTSEKKAIVQYVSDHTKAFAAKIGFAEARSKAIRGAAAKFGKTEAEVKAIAEGK